jgi:hypothetical protein
MVEAAARSVSRMKRSRAIRNDLRGNSHFAGLIRFRAVAPGYRNTREVIAQTAAQSQSDDMKNTISKSPLVSGATACWSEGFDRDGDC